MTSIPPVRSTPVAAPLRPAVIRPAQSGATAPAPPAEPAATAAPATDGVLTPEELEFFAARAALGPLTYRPRGTAAEPAAPPTGQRIDVRG